MPSTAPPTEPRRTESTPQQAPPGDRGTATRRDQFRARDHGHSNADWEPVWRQGLALWTAIATGLAVLPAGHPATVGLLASGILAAPTVPVGLYFSRGGELRMRLERVAAAGRRALGAARNWVVTSQNDSDTGCSGCCC